MDSTYHRAGDTREEAVRRGAEMYSSIYEHIPGYDSSLTMNASADYYHIVRGTPIPFSFFLSFLPSLRTHSFIIIFFTYRTLLRTHFLVPRGLGQPGDRTSDRGRFTGD